MRKKERRGRQRGLKTFFQIGGGVLIGSINGFFGGGGGMLCVPLLNKVLKEETKKAHATAILVILPITIASAVMYYFNGFLEVNNMLLTMGGVIVGGIVGALLLKKLPAKVVGLVFALLMIAAGIKMVI